jgi:aromatic ring-opening dioxygenase catalytic subunit (LigB family)
LFQPNFIEDTEHPAYSKLVEVGLEITNKVKPKAVVVFSAHWQDGPNKISINVAEKTDLIYDFYGFHGTTMNMIIQIKEVLRLRKGLLGG